MKRISKFASILSAALISISVLPMAACAKKDDEVVLRVSNWEEYIDLGDWDSDELIDIDNPYNPEAGGVIGKNSMIDDFTEWFNSGDFGFKVKVEYSTFGTNEDLYNRLNLGDTYDLVCPSEYMIMQLLREGKAKEYSESFLDKSIESNYYARNVSPYIEKIFKDNGWSEYAACYMQGTTGFVYNPEIASVEDVSSWDILTNAQYKRQVTVKDNVRDAYFAALGILNQDELLSAEIKEDRRDTLLNDTNDGTIEGALQILKDIKDNVYSFETDSGKADMITGKVVANYQWSGDGVYIMDEAEADESNPTELWYSVPYESTNLWFDGWVMLKDGIGDDEKKQTAAEAFVNFLSRPDNAIRNMYYIGYTSSIAGDPNEESNMIFDYLEWNYGAEEDGETVLYDYDVSYFFGKNCSIAVDASTLEIDTDGTVNRGRQLFAQYPPQNVIKRSVIMRDFGDRLGAINQMWIDVRCLDVKDFNPAIVWSIVAGIVVIIAAIVIYKFRYQIFKRKDKEN